MSLIIANSALAGLVGYAPATPLVWFGLPARWLAWSVLLWSAASRKRRMLICAT